MKKVLLIAGGWDGHQPERMVRFFAEELQRRGLAMQTEGSLEILADADRLAEFSLIFPCWTMGQLSEGQSRGLLAAVRGGVGLGGVHGGMGDAFRGNTEYEWMVGGHFVGHPHVGAYSIQIRDFASPITAGLPGSFAYESEQYYMLVDPGVHVLADTQYVLEGRQVTMPVAWIKSWGKGRVFYCSLGHAPEEFVKFPEATRLVVQGLIWAAGVF
jgi:type 1 glutamine amidotransferase